MEPAASACHGARPSPAALWQRLEAWNPDPAQPALTFTARLARDQAWPEAYARRVLEEYRRFLFLAITAGHPVSPSKAVDQAWHQHLLETKSYWLEFCPQVLGQPLHHIPSRGGEEEASRHREMAALTLASYRKLFHQEPPPDIWSPAEPKGLPRPAANRPTAKRIVAYAVFLFLIVPFASGLKSYGFDPQALDSLGSVDALAMTGPEFLRFYGLLILLAGLGVLLLRGLLQAVSTRRPPATWQPQAPELAFVAGGTRQSLTAAVLALSEKNTVVVKQGVAFHNPTGEEAEQGLEAAVVEGLQGRGGGRELNRLFQYLEEVDPRMKRLAGDLQAWGLVLSGRRKRLARWGEALLLAPLLLLGITRLVRGIAAGRPVGFLVLELGLLIAAMVWLANNPVHASWQGLRLVRRQRLRLRQPWQAGEEEGGGGNLAQAYALFGMGALPALMALQLTPPPPLPARDPGGVGGGGGSGGGGDGGGGGCGGGCGGCGGCGG
jgi:uncharacterized protein (TIGR04222 family)